MQIEKRLKNHYRRWNIDFPYEEAFLKFRNRLIDSFDKLLGDYLTKNPEIDRKFSGIFKLHKADRPRVKTSEPIRKKSQIDLMMDSSIKEALKRINGEITGYTEKGLGDTKIYKCIDYCETLQDLATIVQIIFWLLEEATDNKAKDLALELIQEIKRISILTASASFVVHKRGKRFILYPHGDEFLDREIIDCTLCGLEDYPKAAKPFEEALRIYLNGETSQYRNLLDNLRFALEQLLKNVLKNDKSLENQKDTLLPWLKEKGLHQQVINLYKELLISYQYYQNNAVKHQEDFSMDEVEFMIYLTGNFMRLIMQLVNQAKDAK